MGGCEFKVSVLLNQGNGVEYLSAKNGLKGKIHGNCLRRRCQWYVWNNLRGKEFYVQEAE